MSRFIILLCFLSFAACSGDSEDTAERVEETTLATETAAPVPAPQSTNQGTKLCEINGVTWAYTKASGIVSRHKKTGKRTAIITFKKKLEKGSETIQLYYDGDNFELERVSAQLKLAKKDGGRMTGFFNFEPTSRAKQPDAQLSGALDLSDPSAAAGTAEATTVNISYEKNLLANPEDAVINITGLSFSGVGYSDLNAVKKQLNM